MLIPRKANLSLKPLLPKSKLLCVTASHFVSSDNIFGPVLPSNFTYMASSLSGLLLHSNGFQPGFVGRVRTGAFIAAGVAAHLGACTLPVGVDFDPSSDDTAVDDCHLR